MGNLDDLAVVVCRPALPKDTQEVMELCSHIWEGNDYIPQVWEEWLADPEGMLGVAEFGGRVAGIFKLTRFGPEEWYMEGLRVHPDFQGRGVAAHIHEFQLQTWRRIGGGFIRLATASYNVKVHRMCERTGFTRIAEFIPYRAPVLDEPVSSFRALTLEEAPRALEFVLNSPTQSLSHGLINLGWVWADPQLKHVQEAIREGLGWWWRDGLGFISIWEDWEEEEHEPAIQLVACPLDKLVELLVDYRRLMGVKGHKTPGWVAPNRPEVLSWLEAAGFQRSWDLSIYIYELRP